MIKYEYKKIKGYEQKKFIENGHTMFETDVLQRLKRLAYLEERLKLANEKQQPEPTHCHIADISNSTPKYDCDDCKHYPCTHQHIMKDLNAKLRYGTCGDHSERPIP